MSFFGVLGSLSRMLPGFVQGERMAVQDNWNDLNQYNKVQAGQIQNAYDEAVFNPRLTREYDLAAASNIGTADLSQNYLLNSLNRARQFRQGYRSSYYDDAIGDYANAGRLYGARQTMEYAMMPPNPYMPYYGQAPAYNWGAFDPSAGQQMPGVQNLPSITR